MSRLLAVFISLYFLLSPSAEATTCFGGDMTQTLIVVACEKGTCQSGFTVECLRYNDECLPKKVNDDLSFPNLQLFRQYLMSQPSLNASNGLYSINILNGFLHDHTITHFRQLSTTADPAKLSELKENYIKAAAQLDTVLKNAELRDRPTPEQINQTRLKVTLDVYLIPKTQRILFLALVLCFFLVGVIKFIKHNAKSAIEVYNIDRFNIIFELTKLVVTTCAYVAAFVAMKYLISTEPNISISSLGTIMMLIAFLPQLLLLACNYCTLRNKNASRLYACGESLFSMLLYGFIAITALLMVSADYKSVTQTLLETLFLCALICMPVFITLAARDNINKAHAENKEPTSTHTIAYALFLFLSIYLLYGLNGVVKEQGVGGCPTSDEPTYTKAQQADFNGYLSKAAQMGILTNKK